MWRTHKGAWVFAATSVCFGRVMEGRSAAPWEQERRAPVRGVALKTVEGAPGPLHRKR